jgi:hypothetical protein
MAELVYLTLFTVIYGAPNTQSAPQTPKFCFLVGNVCCIRNIPQYRLTPAEYRQPKQPSSFQLHRLVLRHLPQVMKNPPCSGFEPGTSRTKVRRSNHYTIELLRCHQPRSYRSASDSESAESQISATNNSVCHCSAPFKNLCHCLKQALLLVVLIWLTIWCRTDNYAAGGTLKTVWLWRYIGFRSIFFRPFSSQKYALTSGHLRMFHVTTPFL